MLDTANKHFTGDLSRARSLLAHAGAVPAVGVRDDVLRAAWMMCVGACDAYFCDAYADLVSRAIRAKEHEPKVQIPDRLNNLKVPVTAVLRQANGGWRWRMAARELIEKENVLSLERVKQLFNHFFRKSHRLLVADNLGPWIIHPQAKQRLFGVSATKYRAQNPSQQGKARRLALERLDDRFERIFQRRHDCIHNCDRPRVSPQPISDTSVRLKLNR